MAESSQDAAWPPLRSGSSHVAMRVRNHLTAGEKSLTPKASPARLAGMSNPCPRPVIQTGKQNNAWEQPCTQSPARLVPGPGSRRLRSSPQLPREPNTCSEGATGPRSAPPAQLSAAVPEIGRPPAASSPDRSQGLSRAAGFT